MHFVFFFFNILCKKQLNLWVGDRRYVSSDFVFRLMHGLFKKNVEETFIMISIDKQLLVQICFIATEWYIQNIALDCNLNIHFHAHYFAKLSSFTLIVSSIRLKLAILTHII